MDHPFRGRLTRRARPPLHAMRMAARLSRARGKTRRVGGGETSGRGGGRAFAGGYIQRSAARCGGVGWNAFRCGGGAGGAMEGRVGRSWSLSGTKRDAGGAMEGARGKCAGAAQGGRGQFPARQGSPVARWRDAWGCHGYGAGRLRTLSDTTRIADVRWRDAWGDRGCGERRPQASLATHGRPWGKRPLPIGQGAFPHRPLTNPSQRPNFLITAEKTKRKKPPTRRI